ncbi:MAG: glycosyltransferase [Acidobacteria bacterium]|nr:glycosyltransferase [Acidobacteriota bacterium]
MSTRVLRILTRLGAGGPPQHCLIANRELAARGYETRLAVGQCGREDLAMDYLLSAEDAVVHIPQMRPNLFHPADAAAVLHLYRLMRDWSPDIVHTHTAKAGLLGRVAAAMAGVPHIVHTFHGNVLRGYFNPVLNAAIRTVERLLARRTDAICVLSPQQRQEIVEQFQIASAAQTAVVPLGMDLPELPQATGEFTVGWLGRLVPVKNLGLLAEVVRRTPLRFVIAGDGPERAVAAALAAEYPGRVEWLGWQQDILPVLARCHVLVQTSRNEGTPVALIQGMGAGRPFVATRVGGVPDVAGAHSIVTAEEPEAISEALLHLSCDSAEWQWRGVEARRFALEQYGKQRMVDQLDRLYQGLLAGAPVAEASRVGAADAFLTGGQA